MKEALTTCWSNTAAGIRFTVWPWMWCGNAGAFPCRPGIDPGEALSAQEFFRLQREYEPVSFFSQELCARYFTYRQGQETYFVLYDDPSTVSSKLNRARRMGLGAAFVLYRDFGPLCRTFLAPSPDASL